MLWIEPIWKMLWSNKALLAILWELNPAHELLLPAYLDGPRELVSYVRKPIFGREGSGIALVRDGEVIEGTLSGSKSARLCLPGFGSHGHRRWSHRSLWIMVGGRSSGRHRNPRVNGAGYQQFQPFCSSPDSMSLRGVLTLKCKCLFNRGGHGNHAVHFGQFKELFHARGQSGDNQAYAFSLAMDKLCDYQAQAH